MNETRVMMPASAKSFDTSPAVSSPGAAGQGEGEVGGGWVRRSVQRRRRRSGDWWAAQRACVSARQCGGCSPSGRPG